MSRVTNVMVIPGNENERGPLSDLQFSGQKFRCITERQNDPYGYEPSGWGGAKWPEIDVYAAAFNHVSVEEVMEALRTIPWSHPEDVRLVIEDDDCKTAGFWVLSEGDWKCVAPMVRW